MPVAHATVKLLLRTDRPKADGTCPVYLRVTANRKKRYTATGVAVEKKHWNEKKARVRASHPLAPTLNATLAEIEAKAQTAALGATSAEAVKAAVGGSSGSLTAYVERFVARLDEDGKLWEWKKYSTTLAKLRGALGNDVSWGELDVAALRRFETYCRKVRKNNPNTTRKELVRLRTVVKRAVREGEIEPADDPFLIYEKPKGKPVHRRKLSLDEVHKLEGVELVPGSVNELARDAFVFAFYAGGMRFGDVCTLRKSDVRDGRVHYAMMKTGARVAVPAPPPALAVLERQSPRADEPLAFPLLHPGDLDDPVRLRRRVSARNAQVNTALKRVAKEAKVEPEGLSMHVARHSFADYARRHSGDLYGISKTLGHGNLQTTEIYLRSFDQDAVDKLGTDLWT